MRTFVCCDEWAAFYTRKVTMSPNLVTMAKKQTPFNLKHAMRLSIPWFLAPLGTWPGLLGPPQLCHNTSGGNTVVLNTEHTEHPCHTDMRRYVMRKTRIVSTVIKFHRMRRSSASHPVRPGPGPGAAGSESRPADATSGGTIVDSMTALSSQPEGRWRQLPH